MTGPGPEVPGLVLVVDDDPDIVRFVEMNLRFEGFDVAVARDGVQALAAIERDHPDLVLLDVMMPLVDGVEVTRRIRADPLTASLPVIMLTARGLGADRVAGLTAGADDYIIKPFDTLELVARVRSTLRRNREIRETSPLTGLPGNTRILRELGERVRRDRDFALCYFDLDRFKSVNDAYGFVRGDEFITLLAHTLHRAVTSAGDPTPFLGHIGGDDFLVLCANDQVQAITSGTLEAFDAQVPGLYDPAHAEARFLEVADRQGRVHAYPLASVSVGVASSRYRRFGDPREVVAVATEMKRVAKSQEGSYIAIDRRRNRA
ncbi:MAG: response regulator [Actinocatenispora sp.]